VPEIKVPFYYVLLVVKWVKVLISVTNLEGNYKYSNYNFKLYIYQRKYFWFCYCFLLFYVLFNRGIIVIGLPYANKESYELKEKMKYLDNQSKVNFMKNINCYY